MRRLGQSGANWPPGANLLRRRLVARMKRLPFLPLLRVIFAGCGMTETTNERSAPAAVAAATAPATNSTPAPIPATPDQSSPPIAGRLTPSRSGWRSHTSGARVRPPSLGIRVISDSYLWGSVDRAFDDGIVQPIRGSDSKENGFSVDGIYLIDPRHAQKYLVARDADNRCICDVDLSDSGFAKQRPLNLSATYGAPAADVQSVDVFVPHFGTFSDVPLG